MGYNSLIGRKKLSKSTINLLQCFLGKNPYKLNALRIASKYLQTPFYGNAASNSGIKY
jgi:hypothetical protein